MDGSSWMKIDGHSWMKVDECSWMKLDESSSLKIGEKDEKIRWLGTNRCLINGLTHFGLET